MQKVFSLQKKLVIFEETRQQTKLKNNIMAKKFICTVCGYVHEGDAAPEKCPLCKVPAEKFKEVVETSLGAKPKHNKNVTRAVEETRIISFLYLRTNSIKSFILNTSLFF